ncbi:hypothetical protein LTR84_002316 [Exophiala bonariae]|uniref:Xylanolytic transcriptional activator regulatory domain-containing protein n=1 Tax=Exophiala bonariae TaxID=1690606 RepID=A0AAV9NEV7_9EURO|nr:hypothetical protein LTR84_002316 [Exophiala bonariae]
MERHGKCRKCHNTGVDCEWKEISKTRRRQRTGLRIMELEDKLSTIMESLHAAQTPSRPVAQDSLASVSQPGDHGTIQVPRYPAQRTNTCDLHLAEAADKGHESVAAPRLLSSLPVMSTLSPEQASGLLADFIAVQLPQYPVISIPVDVTVQSWQSHRPFTLSAAITAACGISEPRLFQSLSEANSQLLCQAAIVEGEKNMDILQALLITAVWCYPRGDLRKLNIHQWTHMACTMAMELGLGGQTSWQVQHRDVDELLHNPSPIMLERFRTMFGVYLTCSRIATSAGRQRMISYSPTTLSAISLFKQSSRDPNDQRLLAWLKLQSIAEDIEKTKVKIANPAVGSATEAGRFKDDIALFEARLRDWEAITEVALLNGILADKAGSESLKIELKFCQSKLYELVVYLDQESQHLDLPQLGVATDHPLAAPQTPFTPTYIRTLLAFIGNCQSILDIILAADVHVVRTLPVLTMLRVPYAFKALAVLMKRMRNPDDSIGRIIDEDTLRWDHYASSVARQLEAASAMGLYAVPAAILKLRDVAGPSPRSLRAEDGNGESADSGRCSVQQPFPPPPTASESSKLFILGSSVDVAPDFSLARGVPAMSDNYFWYEDFTHFAMPPVEDSRAWDYFSGAALLPS